MRRVVLAAMFCGCGFAVPNHATSGEPDANLPPYPTSDGGSSVSRQCQMSDTHLCLEFETPMLVPTIYDGSMYHNDGSATLVQSMERAPGQLAAQLTKTSQIQIPQRAALDIPNVISMEMWMLPDNDTNSWGIYNDGQYALGIDAQKFFCRIGSGAAAVSVHAGSDVHTSEWSHVACTFDAYDLYLYVDGDLVGCAGKTLSPIPTGNPNGTRIGVNFASGIDDVRIYGRVLGPAEIWNHAGVTMGSTSCGGTSNGTHG